MCPGLAVLSVEVNVYHKQALPEPPAGQEALRLIPSSRQIYRSRRDTAAALYVICLALLSSDVSWSRKNNPELGTSSTQ